MDSQLIRSNRDRAQAILTGINDTLLEIDILSTSDDASVRAGTLFNVLHNAGAIARWIGKYVEFRTTEFVELIEVAWVKNEHRPTVAPGGLAIAHDWCLVCGRNFLYNLVHEIEYTVGNEVKDFDPDTSERFWWNFRDAIGKESQSVIDEILVDLKSGKNAASESPTIKEVIQLIRTESAYALAGAGEKQEQSSGNEKDSVDAAINSLTAPQKAMVRAIQVNRFGASDDDLSEHVADGENPREAVRGMVRRINSVWTKEQHPVQISRDGRNPVRNKINYLKSDAESV